MKPAVATCFETPVFLLAKWPEAPVDTRVTLSVPKIPERAALTVLSIASVVPSYTLLAAVTPVTVRAAGVMVPVVEGWVSV